MNKISKIFFSKSKGPAPKQSKVNKKPQTKDSVTKDHPATGSAVADTLTTQGSAGAEDNASKSGLVKDSSAAMEATAASDSESLGAPSLNDAPTGERMQIGFFGRTNAGKSTIVNALTGQHMSVVSATKGTTTDPVTKAMELLPIGPVTIIDTPGYDDMGYLGELRVERTLQVINRVDLAVLVIADRVEPEDRKILSMLEERKVPCLLLKNLRSKEEDTPLTIDQILAGAAEEAASEDNATEATASGAETDGAPDEKSGQSDTLIKPSGIIPAPHPAGPDDTVAGRSSQVPHSSVAAVLETDASTPEGIEMLKSMIISITPEGRTSGQADRHLVADLIQEGDSIVLVIPIDESAPKGRLILPQQQVIRDALESGARISICRPSELAATVCGLTEPPALVITDSQAFGEVSEILKDLTADPADTEAGAQTAGAGHPTDRTQAVQASYRGHLAGWDIPLTSFSILMARYKGVLDAALEGIRAIESLQDGDRVLLAEGCTHHRQCNDIGTVKIPRWLRQHCQVDFVPETASGREFPADLSPYRVVIHCGGCMLPPRDVQWRARTAGQQSVPFINYGVLIAYMNGILEQSLSPLGL